MSRVIFSKKCLKKILSPDSRKSAVDSFKSEAACHVMSSLLKQGFGEIMWCRPSFRGLGKTTLI
jgi:hypothetical protein